MVGRRWNKYTVGYDDQARGGFAIILEIGFYLYNQDYINYCNITSKPLN